VETKRERQRQRERESLRGRDRNSWIDRNLKETLRELQTENVSRRDRDMDRHKTRINKHTHTQTETLTAVRDRHTGKYRMRRTDS